MAEDFTVIDVPRPGHPPTRRVCPACLDQLHGTCTGPCSCTNPRHRHHDNDSPYDALNPERP